MKINITAATIILAAAITLTACTDKEKAEAKALLEQAHNDFDKGDYAHTLLLIDSLRQAHPKAIEERKEALRLYQDASERMAQMQIQENDMAIQKLEEEIGKLAAMVESHKKSGSATAAELSQLTLKRLKLDSLRARFDAQCATVKVIRERRKAKN